ncbi:MAG: hypothetical protein R3C40_11495 [Parvularculaceae bacterium]
MDRPSDDPQEDEPWAKGPDAVVFVYAGFVKDMAKAKAKDARKVEQILRHHFCEYGFVKSKEKWNPNEGVYSVGNRRIKLQAVKGFQCRAYGVVGSWQRLRAFFISHVEPKKQRQKANLETLKRAAEKAAFLIDQIEGASE